MNPNRLSSIDTLRGLVMVIMALDHVRAMLAPPHPPGFDFGDADPSLFFTRWVTHLCAPTFILLAGISAYLYGTRASGRLGHSRFLVTRGLWLVVVEFTFIGFAFNFNLGPQYIPIMQVIWVIGVSMIVLGAIIWLPRGVIAVFAIGLICGHNMLDAIQPSTTDASALWLIFHIQGFVTVGSQPIGFVVYPLVPWLGVMALGYLIGPLFGSGNPARASLLIKTGVSVILVFVALRWFGLYGEPGDWSVNEAIGATLVDFLHTTKYPPSLQFLLMTLGPALLLLGLFEKGRGPLSDALIVIGRVPFLFYVLHLYVIHLVAIAVGKFQGFSVSDIAVAFVRYPTDFGIGLGPIYLLWVIISLSLYPVCKWFAELKARRRDWWLSYL